ncbi:hypothetical protein ACFU7Y_33660 [Kitasatospora sp. NPDC057542]|nr:hypothetical protein [Streptomyces sp. LS1784]
MTTTHATRSRADLAGFLTGAAQSVSGILTADYPASPPAPPAAHGPE